MDLWLTHLCGQTWKRGVSPTAPLGYLMCLQNSSSRLYQLNMKYSQIYQLDNPGSFYSSVNKHISLHRTLGAFSVHLRIYGHLSHTHAKMRKWCFVVLVSLVAWRTIHCHNPLFAINQCSTQVFLLSAETAEATAHCWAETTTWEASTHHSSWPTTDLMRHTRHM